VLSTVGIANLFGATADMSSPLISSPVRPSKQLLRFAGLARRDLDGSCGLPPFKPAASTRKTNVDLQNFEPDKPNYSFPTHPHQLACSPKHHPLSRPHPRPSLRSLVFLLLLPPQVATTVVALLPTWAKLSRACATTTMEGSIKRSSSRTRLMEAMSSSISSLNFQPRFAIVSEK
jgi:hypothetical protein